MKKHFKLVMLSVFTLLSMIFGCRKNVKEETSINGVIDIESIRSAYYRDQRFKMVGTPVNDSLFIVWRPQWQLVSRTTKNGITAYYIPFKPEILGELQPNKQQIQTNEAKYLVARETLAGFDFYYANSTGQSVSSERPKLFSGRLLFSEMGAAAKGYKDYRNGMETTSPNVHTEACLYYNTCTWVGYCNGVQTVVYTRGEGTAIKSMTCGIPYIPGCGTTTWYSGWSGWDVYCSPDEIPSIPPPVTTTNPEPGSGSGGAGGGSLGSGGGGAYKLDSIVNDTSLKDPCFIWAAEVLKSPNTRTTITGMFNQIFGGSGEFTAVFGQGHYGGIEGGHTQPENNYYINFMFNVDVLTGSSKELVVATALHEMLHGIFKAKKVMTNDPLEWGEVFQHTIMAASYVNNMAEALQSIFPGLSWSDAEALAWEGLQDTQAWLLFAQANPTEANNILLRGDQYDKNHNKGTRCPN